MNANTITTLAEYIARLHKEQSDYFKDYANDEFDTNGVEQDHVETFWPPDTSSGANSK